MFIITPEIKLTSREEFIRSWAELLLRCDLDRLVPRVAFRAVPLNPALGNLLGLWVEMPVLDASSSQKMILEQIVGVYSFLPTMAQLSHNIRLAIKSMIDHEIDECLFFDEHNRFNPHKFHRCRWCLGGFDEWDPREWNL